MEQPQANAVKTGAVFSRYNIVSEAGMRDATPKVEEGSKAVIHKSFMVAQESGAALKRTRKPVSLGNQ